MKSSNITVYIVFIIFFLFKLYAWNYASLIISNQKQHKKGAASKKARAKKCEIQGGCQEIAVIVG